MNDLESSLIIESKRNVEKAKEYSAEVLSNRKIGFYKLLRELVEKQKVENSL
jgi:hypothetical protein